MAITYIAAKSNSSTARVVFATSASEGVVLKSDDSIPEVDLVAVTETYAIAQAIATALNGGL